LAHCPLPQQHAQYRAGLLQTAERSGEYSGHALGVSAFNTLSWLLEKEAGISQGKFETTSSKY
jgi:hypothetical protein